MPRIVSRQTKRSNPPAETAYEYYRRAVFLPYLDTVIGQLDERFEKHKVVVKSLSCFLPKVAIEVAESHLSDCEGDLIYDKFLPGSQTELEFEFKRWREFWLQNEGSVPETIIGAYKACKKMGSFPMTQTLLKIFATLPVTTASSERSFSALKIIKSYLRSTMGETRLNGLSTLYINKDILLDIDQVIDEFGRQNRLLKFN